MAQSRPPIPADRSLCELTGAAHRWVVAFCVAIPLTYILTFVAFLGRVGPRDYDQFLVFHELQFWNRALFGLAKQWAPVMCTGLSLAGEPQVPFMSLSMMLGYLVGPLAGLESAIAIYFLAAWLGAFLYAGLWLKPAAARALAASLFIGNGFFICRLSYGHVDFIPFLALPLFLWAMHRCLEWRGACTWEVVLPVLLGTLLLGAGISVVIDGSPVAIIHLMLWICLYGVVLAVTARSTLPLMLLACALCIATLLDAGYLWPMVAAQFHFPRLTADSFTSPLSLLWFLVVPMRGKLLPANGNGHELSVFVGPLIAWWIWRYRVVLMDSMPLQMRRPLLVVSIFSLLFGMGSLALLHWPRWLSPFDLVRSWPGFRSIEVTGRYWGFLALPLALFGAAAIWRFAAESASTLRLHVWMGCALAIQVGFQIETLLAEWVPSYHYHAVAVQHDFRRGAETIAYVRCGERDQGQCITPTRAVLDCYDRDDFRRADVNPGSRLIKQILADKSRGRGSAEVRAAFLAWDRIRITLEPRLNASGTVPGGERIRIVLNQAFHPLWRATDCQVSPGNGGNMVVDCDLARLRQRPVILEFDDPVSDLGARVSLTAWAWWATALAVLLAISLAHSRRGARRLVSRP